MDNNIWASFGATQENPWAPSVVEEPRTRTLFDRIFAPFEAPQQFLYKLTTGIGEDGFQLGDFTTALSHGTRYFNPFAEVERVDENDVRQVFFGEDQEGDNRLAQGALNLGIALLYDPLWFLAPAKGAATAAGMSARGVSVLEKVMNPAQLLFDGASMAGRVTTGLARRGLAAGVGANRAEEIGTRVAQNFISRYAGLPEEAQAALRTFEASKRQWRNRGYQVLKTAQNLGGRQAQELLAEAMELDAIYHLRRGADLTREQQRAYETFGRRLADAGIDEGKFMETYDAYRRLDDEIGESLVQLGAISGREFQEYQGVHLRRVFEAFEKPEVYIDRVEALVDTLPETRRTNIEQLTTSLSNFETDLKNLATSSAFRNIPESQLRLFDAPAAGDVASGVQGNLRQYFNPDSGVFETERFARDFDDIVRANATATPDEIMRITQEQMLGIRSPDPTAPLDLARADAKVYKTLLNYMSGSLEDVQGAARYRDILRQRMSGAPMTWRTMQENMKLLTERVNLPDELRAALGEVTTAAPRLAREVGDVTDLLEFRRFADQLAGITRWGADDIAQVDEVRQMMRSGNMTRQQAAEELSRRLGEEIDPNDIDRITEGSIRSAAGSSGVSSDPNRIRGAAVKLPEDPRLGSLSGMYVKPAIARTVQNVVGRNTADLSTVEKMWQTTGQLLRQGTSFFKLSKVVLDPTAQARNFIGNAVLADFAGVQPFRPDLINKTVDTLRTFARGEMNQYARAAAASGYDLMGSTFSKQELRGLADNLSRIDATQLRDSPTTLMGKVYEAFNAVTGNYVNRMGDLFQTNEEFFKMSVFIDKYEKLRQPLIRRGKTITPDQDVAFARQAAALAEEALFNYADIPYIAQYARDYGVVPFITFPIKATQFTAQVLYNNPHRALKYHRIGNEWSDYHSGGPDETAREVAALPQYIREAMVIRLPFEDTDGRPQYLDLSYFMPYAVIADLAKMAQNVMGEGVASPSDYGLREGFFSPPILGLFNALSRNEDSLGRPIVKPEYDITQRFQAIGNFVAEFILPPSFPGGSRAETIGRALQAMSRTSDEPIAWAEALAVPLRGFGPEQNNVFTYPGQRPQTGAAVGGAQLPQLFGLEPDNPLSMLWGAGVETGILGGATASDRGIAARQEMVSRDISVTEIARQMAQIRSDPDLSPVEKRRRLERLQERRREALQNAASNLRAMR